MLYMTVGARNVLLHLNPGSGMALHGMQNIDDIPGAFLGCICSLYGKDAV